MEEITEWQGHSAEQLKAVKDGIERLRALGVEAIDDRLSPRILGPSMNASA